jgi:hypothetical protein
MRHHRREMKKRHRVKAKKRKEKMNPLLLQKTTKS